MMIFFLSGRARCQTDPAGGPWWIVMRTESVPFISHKTSNMYSQHAFCNYATSSKPMHFSTCICWMRSWQDCLGNYPVQQPGTAKEKAMESVCAVVWVWTLELHTLLHSVALFPYKGPQVKRTTSISPSVHLLPPSCWPETTNSNRQPDGNAGLCRISSCRQSFHRLDGSAQDPNKKDISLEFLFFLEKVMEEPLKERETWRRIMVCSFYSTSSTTSNLWTHTDRPQQIGIMWHCASPPKSAQVHNLQWGSRRRATVNLRKIGMTARAFAFASLSPRPKLDANDSPCWRGTCWELHGFAADAWKL